jgi:hypothetical protein
VQIEVRRGPCLLSIRNDLIGTAAEDGTWTVKVPAEVDKLWETRSVEFDRAYQVMHIAGWPLTTTIHTHR